MSTLRVLLQNILQYSVIELPDMEVCTAKVWKLLSVFFKISFDPSWKQ